MGPNEKRVRDTLPSRAAAKYYALPQNVQHCFSGLFNGALSRGRVNAANDGLFIGKAECEWDWRETWTALQDAGLIVWRLEDETFPNGHKTTNLIWGITEKGQTVSDDDLTYFRALMDAMREDDLL